MSRIRYVGKARCWHCEEIRRVGKNQRFIRHLNGRTDCEGSDTLVPLESVDATRNKVSIPAQWGHLSEAEEAAEDRLDREWIARFVFRSQP